VSFPTELVGRRAMRKQIRDRAIAKAARLGLTITCAEYTDHSTCRGATVCLCECHDPEERP